MVPIGFEAETVIPSRSHGLSLLLMLVTVAGGLVIRFAPLGLPSFVMKYGGSMLWAITVYWIVSSLLTGPYAAGLLAAVLTVAVECFKLYHSPWLDAFRRTLPGVLLLGRFFSMWDIVAYGFAILAGVGVDRYLRRQFCRSWPCWGRLSISE